MSRTTPDVVTWAETNWIVPETKRPIVLREWQKAALYAMFPPDGSPSVYETFLLSGPKKCGKTTTNAIATCYAALTFPAPETAYIIANDQDQAVGRVFVLISDAIRTMRMPNVKLTATEIRFPTGTRIIAVASDFAGSAGAIFGISSWTELWSFRYEGHIRLYEELTPLPNRRSLRIVDSYAGFSGDSPLLEPMWERALAGKRLDRKLPIFEDGKTWAFVASGEEGRRLCWLGKPEEAAAYYAEQRRTLRPGTFARLHHNVWQSGEEAFISGEEWDACVERDWLPLQPDEDTEPPLRLSLGVDVAVKHDCSAVVAVAHDGDKVRLVQHRIWTPRRGQTIDLEQTVEAYLRHLRRYYRVASIQFDPSQMLAIAERLRREGFPMHELPQTSANLTSAAQNLYELIQARMLALYPDKELRRHALNAVALETPRGWRLAKEKSSHKIDGLAALSFACLDAIERPSRGRLPRPQQRDPAISVGMADMVF